MNCPKCKSAIPEGSAYCNMCGRKLSETASEKKHKPKQRGNGTGTAIKRGSTWTARVVVGWKTAPDYSHKIPVYRTKGVGLLKVARVQIPASPLKPRNLKGSGVFHCQHKSL